jgi:hypothetical protein
MRLKEGAGWNQAPEDWERFLAMSPTGCFAAERDGLVIGTATTAAPVKQPSEFKVIGKSFLHRDAREKVTGQARYAGDIRLPGCSMQGCCGHRCTVPN